MDGIGGGDALLEAAVGDAALDGGRGGGMDGAGLGGIGPAVPNNFFAGGTKVPVAVLNWFPGLATEAVSISLVSPALFLLCSVGGPRGDTG